jgi:tripartite-type tricarboxylate transporter receptor subunit TctC
MPFAKEIAMICRKRGLRIGQWVIPALLLATSGAPASPLEDYPNHTIKIVVPLPPGVFADALPRIIADKLSSRWSQPVVIENRSGFASNLGAEFVARAEPDGYSLLATPQGPLVVNPQVQASTFQELVALARANPDKITFASAGIGSPPHLTAEMLMAAAGVRMVHVPYKGLAPAMTDLLAGHVDVMFDNLANVLPQIKSGTLRALAVSDKARIPELPDLPAIAETYPGFYSAGWYAVVAPPKTPLAIAKTLSAAIAETLKLPDVAKKLADFSARPVGSSPEETGTFLKQESERWRQVIVSAGITEH